MSISSSRQSKQDRASYSIFSERIRLIPAIGLFAMCPKIPNRSTFLALEKDRNFVIFFLTLRQMRSPFESIGATPMVGAKRPCGFLVTRVLNCKKTPVSLATEIFRLR